MSKLNFRIAWLIAGPLLSFGQEKKFEPLSIDRPDVSNLPTTVRPLHFQFELGAEYGIGPSAKKFEAPNLVFRTGLSKRSELRLGVTHAFNDSTGYKRHDNIFISTISVKYRIVEEKGARPAIALQPEVALPFGHGAEVDLTEANFTLMDYSLTVLFNNTLHEKVFLNYNAGILSNQSGNVEYLVSASTSFAHTNRLGYFLEAYSIFGNGKFPISVDGGVTYLVHPRVQFDIYGGNPRCGRKPILVLWRGYRIQA